MEDCKLSTQGTGITGETKWMNITIREAVASLRGSRRAIQSPITRREGADMALDEGPSGEGTLHKKTLLDLQKIERCLSSSMRLVEVQTGRFTYAM